MIALYILGALLLIIIIVMLIRIGVYISFGGELCVRAKIGPLTMQLIPKTEKANKPKKPKKEKKKKEEKEPEQKLKEKKKPNLTFEDIRSAFPVLMEALGNALRKAGRGIRIDPMRLSVTFGHDDPAKTSEMYGWGCSAMWTLMPRLEQHVRLPDPQIHLDVDYNAVRTRAEGEIMISLLIGDIFGILGSLGVPILKWFLTTKRKKRAAEKTSTIISNEQDHNKGE